MDRSIPTRGWIDKMMISPSYFICPPKRSVPRTLDPIISNLARLVEDEKMPDFAAQLAEMAEERDNKLASRLSRVMTEQGDPMNN